MKSKALRNYLDFTWAMTEREIKARYKRAVFGFLWVVLNPLAQMIVIGSIFSHFVSIPNYFLFLLSGLLPWQFFSMSISKTTPSIFNEKNLLKKSAFPRESIPISIVLSNFIHLLIAITILLAISMLISGLSITQFLILVCALIWLLCITIGISLLTSSFNVQYRDINFFSQSILILWFYLTPILYSIETISNNFTILFALNPLTSVFEMFHLSLTGQGEIDLSLVIGNLIISFIVITAGIISFSRKRLYFNDWL